MTIYFKNNTSDLLFISGLKFKLEKQLGDNLYNVSEAFDFEKDLCGEESLLKLLAENKITVFIDDRELNSREAVDMFTLSSYLEDSENEMQYYKKNSKIKISPFTQLNIRFRPLQLEDNSEIVLGEGSDIIIDNGK